MTYRNDNSRRGFARENDRDPTALWISGILGVGVMLAFVFWAANRNPDTTPDPRPTATTPATTTGSSPNGTTPPKDTSKPAQVPTVPTAR